MAEIAHSAGPEVLGKRDDEALERRLWRNATVLVAAAVVVSAIFAPWRVTTGLLLGAGLSLFNLYWLRSSLRAIFGGAQAATKAPRRNAARYVLRYFVIGLVVASAYTLNLISIAATIAGLCAFAAAIMLEAITQFYFAIVHREDN